jgi:flagellar hook-basal body complex protein FliE
MTAPIGYPEQFGALLDARRAQNPISPGPNAGAPPPGATGAPRAEGLPPSAAGEPAKLLGPSFAQQLAQFVGDVDKTQKGAQHQAEDFAVGHNNDIHGTMIAVEQAEISLHLLANVRNRVVDLYREVMRMGS